MNKNLELTGPEAHTLKELVSVAWWEADRERQRQEPNSTEEKDLLEKQRLLEGLSEKLRTIGSHLV